MFETGPTLAIIDDTLERLRSCNVLQGAVFI